MSTYQILLSDANVSDAEVARQFMELVNGPMANNPGLVMHFSGMTKAARPKAYAKVQRAMVRDATPARMLTFI